MDKICVFSLVCKLIVMKKNLWAMRQTRVTSGTCRPIQPAGVRTLVGAVELTTIADCQAAMMPVKWRIFMKTCICCKLVFGSGVCFSIRDSCQLLLITEDEIVFFYVKEEHLPFLRLKSSLVQSRTYPSPLTAAKNGSNSSGKQGQIRFLVAF